MLLSSVTVKRLEYRGIKIPIYIRFLYIISLIFLIRFKFYHFLLIDNKLGN